MVNFKSLLKKDLILGIKDIFIILEVAFAIVVAIFIRFIVPAEVDNEAVVFIYDKPKLIENFVMTYNPNVEDEKGEFYVDSREEVIEGIRENKSAIGLIIHDFSNGKYKVELLSQPYTKEGLIHFIEKDIEDLLSIIHPPVGIYTPDIYETVEIRAMQSGLKDDIPLNHRMLPPIIYMMVGIMGLFAMVSLVGQEREDMTLRAYRVSPGKVWEFLLSKNIVIVITSIVCFSVIYIVNLGFKGFTQSLLITLLTLVLGSAIGVILGSFFKTPLNAISWVLLIMIILSLPAVSLMVPTFNPGWLKLIPSYHTLFSLEAAMFPDNNSHIIWQGALVLTAINIVIIPVSTYIFKHALKREV